MHLTDKQRRFLFSKVGPFYSKAKFRLKYQRSPDYVETILTPTAANRLKMSRDAIGQNSSPAVQEYYAKRNPAWRRIQRASGGKSVIFYRKGYNDPSTVRHERIHAMIHNAPGVDDSKKAYMYMDELRGIMGLSKRQFSRYGHDNPLQEAPAYRFETIRTKRERAAAERWTKALEDKYGKPYSDRMRAVLRLQA